MRPLYEELERRGIESTKIRYGYVLIPVSNTKAVSAVLDQTEPGDILVGFSNGAWAIAEAVKQGAPAGGLILVSGALRSNWEFPKGIHVFNYYCPFDGVLTTGNRWARAVSWMPWRWGEDKDHGWGDVGRYGYDGPSDAQVRNLRLPYKTMHQWHKREGAVRMVADGCEVMLGKVE